MKKFFVSSLIFGICLYIAPALTASVAWLAAIIPFGEIWDFFMGMPQDAENNPDAYKELIEATIWTLIILYLILPAIRGTLAPILPVAASYRDTRQIRFTRYIGLCILLLFLPSLILITLGTLWDIGFAKAYVNAAAHGHIGGDISGMQKTFSDMLSHKDPLFFEKFSEGFADAKPQERFAQVLMLYDAFKPQIIFGSLLFLVLAHWLLFQHAALLNHFIEFFDSGKRGKGGNARFSNLIEEIMQRWSKQQNTLFLGNSLFIPWLQFGPKSKKHMLTIAGSRSGKGATCIIPNLLAWQGSVVCLDPKGTNYMVTKEQRRKQGAVQVIDPFSICEAETNGFNPLADIDAKDPMAIDRIRVLSRAIIYDESGGKNQYFTNEARDILTGYIAFVIANSARQENAKPASLIDAYRIIMTMPDEERDIMHDQMMAYQGALDSVINETAMRIYTGISKPTNEFLSVMSTLRSQIRWMASPAIQKVLSQSSVTFQTLREKPTSIYLILPPDNAADYEKLQRLVITSAFRALQKGGRSPVPCLCLVDEAHSLGYMEEIPKAYGYLAGMNICIWTFWQNKGQIDQLYGENFGTMVTNSRAVQIFGVSDDASLDFISKRLGQRRLMGNISLTGVNTMPVQFRETQEISHEISATSGLSYVMFEDKYPFLLQRIEYFKSWQWFDMASADPDYPNPQEPWKLSFINLFRKALPAAFRKNPFLTIFLALWFFKIIGLIIGAIF